jgi:hypothetical protein
MPDTDGAELVISQPLSTPLMRIRSKIDSALVIVLVGSSLGACSSVPHASTEATPQVSPPSSEPQPTAIVSLETDFAGVLRVWQTCLLLDTQAETYELLLPDGYWQKVRGGRLHILNQAGDDVGVEGERVGVDGEAGEGGSFCMLGPQIEATRIMPIESASS